MSRLVCGTCGASFNTTDQSLCPRIEGICDKCGHLLKVRSDDNEETFVNRFNTYVNSTKPLLDYYRNKGILREVEVHETDTVNDIFEKVKNLID
jgi:adenylate kinase